MQPQLPQGRIVGTQAAGALVLQEESSHRVAGSAVDHHLGIDRQSALGRGPRRGGCRLGRRSPHGTFPDQHPQPAASHTDQLP